MNPSTRIPALSLSLALLSAAPAFAQSGTELLDRVAAIVGNSVIMDSQIEDRMELTRQRLRESNTPLPPDSVLEVQVMDRLIVESLLKQRARRAGIQITAEEINAATTELARQNNLTQEEFYESLKEQGYSYDRFLTTLREDLLLQKVNQVEVRPRIQITDDEIDRFLESTAGETILAREYQVHHIMLPIEGNRPAAEARAREILDQLEQGEKFESLAVQHSQARTALQGGNLGWRKLSQLPEVIADRVRTMSVGDLAGPIGDNFALHLIRLTDRRGDTVRYAKERNLRHILLKPSALRTLQQAEEEIASLRRRIELGEDFTALASIHSEDPNSALSGGSLGWVQDEQLPQSFVQALDGTPEGQLTQPFQTSTGWHIAQMLESRTSDLTEETSRNRAFQFLYERKFEEELTRFMHEVRTQAYVELKDRSDDRP